MNLLFFTNLIFILQIQQVSNISRLPHSFIQTRCDLHDMTALRSLWKGILYSAYQITHSLPVDRGTVLSCLTTSISQELLLQFVSDLNGFYFFSFLIHSFCEVFPIKSN